MASEAFCEQMLRVQTAMNLKWFWQPHSALTGGIEGPPLFFFFCNYIFLFGFLPWEIWIAFLRESQLQQSHATQPTVYAGCFGVSMIR